MTFQEIIQSVGKQIEKKVYYYENNVRVDIAEDNIEEVKIKFNTGIVGTLMKSVELVLKENLQIESALYVELTAKLGSDSETQTYGPYYIYETTYNADDKTYEHICYDTILKTMIDYEKLTLTYPVSIQTYYNALITKLGLTSNVSLINGQLMMLSDMYDGIDYTYRSVLQDIAEANGILLYADGNEIKEASFGDSSSAATITDDILMNTNIDFGEHYGPINSIVLSRAADSDNVYVQDNASISINGLCEFKISNNQLMSQNNRSDFLAGLLTKLDGIEYDIYDTKLVGYGGFTPLQKIQFETGDNTYSSYALNNEITLTSSYEEQIYSEMPSQSVTNYSAADLTDQRINQTYMLVDKQNGVISSYIEQTDGKISSQDSKISSINQKVDSIDLKIKTIANLTVSAESSYAEVNLTGVNESEPINIKVHPIIKNITCIYPNSYTFPSSNTKMTTRKIRFYNSVDDKTYDYEMPEDLLYLNADTYDEFIFNYETQQCSVIKRCSRNSSGNVIAITEETHDYDFPSGQIQLTDGNYTVSLLGYNSGYLSVTLMASNIYTTQFATKAEVTSQISVKQQEIDLSVDTKLTNVNQTIENNYTNLSSQLSLTNQAISAEVTRAQTNEETISGKIELKIDKDDNNRIVSMLNAAANQITLAGGSKINLTTAGKLLITAGNFKLDSSGNMTASNGTFSGKITSNSATITGGSLKLTNSGGTTAVFTNSNTSTGGVTSIRGDRIEVDNTTQKGTSKSEISSTRVFVYDTNNSDKYAQLNKTSLSMHYNSSNYTNMYANGTSAYWFLYKGSTYTACQAGSTPTTSSDRRLKENIKSINEEQSVNIIKNLSPVTYNFIEDDRIHRGLIAQEVIETLNENGVEDQIYRVDERGYYGLEYTEFVMDLINCNKYLLNKVEELEKRITDMEEK